MLDFTIPAKLPDGEPRPHVTPSPHPHRRPPRRRIQVADLLTTPAAGKKARAPVPTCAECGAFADECCHRSSRRYCILCGVDLDDPTAPRIDWTAPYPPKTTLFPV